ncbi:MAG: DinB family protein [Phycisphaerae bacterium]|nr:DinB family protein [Phycisphaerae bacterium]NUQ44754.1 DinB family protein [Phycisphaerae bacterium]
MNHRDPLTNQIDIARKWTNSLLADISDDDLYWSPRSGLHTAAWIIGHITWAQWGLIAVRCLQRDHLPEPYTTLFGRGTTPSPDASTYPPAAHLRSEFARVHEAIKPLIRNMTDAQLDAPLGGPPHPLLLTARDAVSMVAMHETFHAGQLGLLRRLMGREAMR